MRLRHLPILGVVILQFLYSTDATSAQKIAQCDKNLGKSVEQETTNDAVRIAWLYTIDKNTFQDMQQGVQSGGEVIVKLIPIKGYLNYNQFRKDVEELHEKYQYDYTEERARWYVRTYFSDSSEAGYAECLKTVRSQLGVSVWVKKDSTPETAHIEIQWFPAGIDRPENIHMDVRNGRKPKDLLRIWQGIQDHVYLFDREPDKDLHVNVNLGNFGDEVVVPVPPDFNQSRHCGTACNRGQCARDSRSGKYSCGGCTIRVSDLLQPGTEHLDIPEKGRLRFACSRMEPARGYNVLGDGTMEALFSTTIRSGTYYVGQALDTGEKVQWWVSVGYKLDPDDIFQKGYETGQSEQKSIKAGWSSGRGIVPNSGIVSGEVYVEHNQISSSTKGPLSLNKDFVIKITAE